MPQPCPRRRPLEAAFRTEEGGKEGGRRRAHLATGVGVDGWEATGAGSSPLKGAEIGEKIQGGHGRDYLEDTESGQTEL